MTKNLTRIIWAFVALIFVSCSQSGKSGLQVPKDAGFVMHIDLKSLSGKLSWDEIKQSNWFKEASLEATDSLAQKLLNDPSSSGIDSDGSFVLFTAQHAGSAYIAFQGDLKDPEAYEKAILATTENKIPIVASDDLKTMQLSNGDGLLVWNNKKFIIVNNTNLGELGNNSYNEYGELQGSGKQIPADSLLKLTKNILALKGDQLLDSDKRFAELLSEKADMHFWANSSALVGESINMMTSMMKVGSLIEGNLSAGTLNFDNGKIAITGTQYFGEELTNLIKSHTPATIDDAVLNKLPSGDVFAAGVFNFPPNGLKELAKLTGTNGVLNGYLGEVGYSFDEFIQANKGNIAFAITDINMKEKTITYDGLDGKKESYTSKSPDVSFVAGVSVNNKEAFGKMISIIQSQIKPSDNANPEIQYNLGDDWFSVSNNAASLTAFAEGKNKPEYASKLKGHHGAFYLNLESLLTNIRGLQTETSSDDSKILDASIKFWDDVLIQTDIKAGKAHSSMTINLNDKNTNSLKQLNQYFDNLATELKKKEVQADTYREDSANVKIQF